MTDRPAKRSRLFRAQPHRLLVEEWAPATIALPTPPPQAMAEPADGPQIGEDGLPEPSPGAEPEPDEPMRTGPVRLFVGRGRPAPPPAVQAEAEPREVPPEASGFFMAELTLPRPEDLGQLGIRAALGGEGESADEVALDTVESSDPSFSRYDEGGGFELYLEAPEPARLARAEVPAPRAPTAPPPPSAEASRAPATPTPPPSRAPASQAPVAPASPPLRAAPILRARPDPTVVLRSKPFWTRERRIPDVQPVAVPSFHPREERERPRRWKRWTDEPSRIVLAVLLVVFLGLLARAVMVLIHSR